MLIIKESALRGLQEAIIAATHSIVDQDGHPVTLGTVESQRLDAAALVALVTATGEVVWPANKPIDLPKPHPTPGPFRNVV